MAIMMVQSIITLGDMRGTTLLSSSSFRAAYVDVNVV